ncbi:hypothetical protein [uncultured Desulfobacter sp.]|uniref:hypothetical protein n=1 Tax=uncultured Desulfobacter sp. TaxID=240139 RepID=UPI002AAB82A3|nr:hypothetical protein [uncultured Desulfobacter sp.]
MGTVDRILDATKQAILINERMQNMSKALERLAYRLDDHEKRLVRLETYVEIANLSKQLPDK